MEPEKLLEVDALKLRLAYAEAENIRLRWLLAVENAEKLAASLGLRSGDSVGLDGTVQRKVLQSL